MSNDKPVVQPSSRELEVLETMWKAGRPLSGTEIIGLSPDKTWKESTIHIILKSLVKKSLIENDGFTQTSTNIAKTFSPLLSADEYLANQISGSKIYKNRDRVSFGSIVATLLKQADNENEKKTLVDELRKIIDETDADPTNNTQN